MFHVVSRPVMRATPLLAAVAVLSVPAGAQVLASTSTMANPPRASATAAMASRADQPPVLDARCDDPAWRQAQVIDQFLEYEPTEGAETRFKTEARVTYDDKNLYVCVDMFDPAPDSIVKTLARRDVRVHSEHIKLVIDSYNDKRTAYQFASNPAGTKRDFYVYNDNVEDASWDAVWDVAAGITSTGWVAEFKIPFSQLRFANKPEHTFGLMIVRDVARTSARISWPLFSRKKQGYVSQSGEIAGIRGIPSPRRLEVAPYVVTKNSTERVPNTTVEAYRHPSEITGGADIKYGLSSNLTLDATINPDFGQVEADPAQLNLTAFETFFSERRPFFLEGTGIFTFRVNCGDIDTGCTGLFYSRRIGRSPFFGGEPGDPTASTILGAAKLTGRLPGGLSVGVLDAVTQREVSPNRNDRTIEPQTNYGVVRLQQDLNKGSSGLGIMATAVNRSLDEATRSVLPEQAYAIGVDGRHRFWKNNYEVAAMVSASTVRGDENAIAGLQRNGVHRYQRPDDDLAFDPTRRSLTGDAQRISFSKFGGGITRFQTVYQRYGPGYDINDLGFLSRADEQMFRNWFAFQLSKPTKHYRQAFINLNSWHNWSAGGLPTNFGLNTNSHVWLPNQWWVHAGVTVNDFHGGSFDDRIARGGPAVRKSTNMDLWTGLEMDRRWRVQPFLFTGLWRNDRGHSHGVWFEPSFEIRATSQLTASLGGYYEHAYNDNQWHSNVVNGSTTHYTFARLDQTTTRLRARFNYTASPNVSFQFFAEPFVTTGSYSKWRELGNPRSKNYDEIYVPYAGGDPGGFNVKELNTNAVLRWEYRPGSTLFVVWQQGREQFRPGASDFDFRRDYQDLFERHPNNTFLIKASYWFSY